MKESRVSALPAGGVIAFAVLLALALTALGIVPAASQEVLLRAWSVEQDPQLQDPWSQLWGKVTPRTVALSGQNAAKPLGGGEIRSLKVRALHDGERLYIMLEWRDATENNTLVAHTDFADAAAVQFPALAGVSIPSFCMGDARATVNIWHWKAAWQRDIDEGYYGVHSRYPNMQVDTYPNPGERLFFPARESGNLLAVPSYATPVENLVSSGFGTLTTSDVQNVDGTGEWRNGQWRVVFARDLASGPGYPELAVGDLTNIAFAVWEGSAGNRNGMKSVSQFMNLQLTESELEFAGGGFPWWGWVLAAAAVVALLGGIGAAYLPPSLRRL
jgi:hypothetical protein